MSLRKDKSRHFEERIPLLVLFWGDAKPYVTDAPRRRGTKVFLQVGSVAEAVAAADAGVDAVIAQGVEAGGHANLHNSTARFHCPLILGSLAAFGRLVSPTGWSPCACGVGFAPATCGL